MTFACKVLAMVVTVALLLQSLLLRRRWGLGLASVTCLAGEGEDDGLNLLQASRERTTHHLEPVAAFMSSFAPLFFQSDAIETVLPLPPENYPSSLQGMLWLDESGVYGPSNLPFVFNTLIFTFGGSGKLDTTTRKVSVHPAGPAWTWWNDALAYFEQFVAHEILGAFYVFEFNEDYTFAQIIPVFQFFRIFPKIRVPVGMVNFTMMLQRPKPGQCPPSPTATKKDIGKCAKWRRESSAFSGPIGIYYMWEVVDKDRKRVQPYCDEYLKWANQNTNASPFWAQLFLGKGLMSETPHSSFVGVWDQFQA